ncbi:hypothetical protein ACOMHN_046645 [Nucella lapillus]
MNAKQKEILQVQRSLLSRNIVWSPALASALRAQHLLTDSMIAQIEHEAQTVKDTKEHRSDNADRFFRAE